MAQQPVVRHHTFQLMTANLPGSMEILAEIVKQMVPADDGERYAVTLVVEGPLTVEEVITTLWAKMQAAQSSMN